MTLIVGATWRNRCWLGADGAVHDPTTLMPTATPKVWAMCDGALVVGVSGHLGAAVALREVQWQLSPRWLLHEGPGAIAAALEREGLDANEPSALLGMGGRLYYYETRQVYEAADRFAALGCADHFGLGWLAATQSGWHPRERLRACLTAATRYCMGVGGRPVVVHTTG